MIKKHRTLGELFTALKALNKNADKTELLRANYSYGLHYFLKLAYNDVTWLVPKGLPPFKPDTAPVGYSPSNLLREFRTFYLYLQNEHEPSTLSQFRREQLFQQLLERLHADEVQLLTAAKDGTLAKEYKLPKTLINSTFPGLLDEPVRIRYNR